MITNEPDIDYDIYPTNLPFFRKWIIPISAEFISHSSYMAKRHGWGRIRCDSLLFEWFLLRSQIVTKPKNWRHDFIYNDMKIDVKEIHTKYFNVHNGKLDQYKESVMMGELSHFLFYSSDKPDRAMIKGDIVTVKPFALCNARKIIKIARHNPSEKKRTEAFVHKETLIMLDESKDII